MASRTASGFPVCLAVSVLALAVLSGCGEDSEGAQTPTLTAGAVKG